jgi:hypothetical protein
MRKVAPKLSCGLGNRLFQMVAAIKACEDSPDCEPVILLPRYTGAEHGDYQLLFTLFPNIRILETADSWVEVGTKEYDSLVPKIPNAPLTLISGFFQNSDNFPSLSNKYLPSLPNYLPPTNGWAIHFRFGDYQNLPHYHVGLSRYYGYVLRMIPKDTHLHLFSDSPGRLSPIAEELRTIGYTVEIFQDSNTLKTLQKFASCQGGSICSNSTFSWWASFFAWRFANDVKYRAFFPDRWMNNSRPVNLFEIPYTFPIPLVFLDALPSLNSFSHS